MKSTGILLSVALLSWLAVTQAMADCQIADAKLEEPILHQENLRGSANRQSVRDLRRLRDAALILQSYGRDADCERLLGNIRELISGPAMTSLGDSDEDNAEKQMDAPEPQAPRGGTLGHRSDKNAQPLLSIENLSPALRTDEIIGAEVRSSNDKIVGEVRSLVLDFKDHRDYAIVASGGFFTPGKESIAVPVLSLRVSQNRQSFFLPMPESDVKKVPVMPGDDYKWLSDAAWRARNDALFVRPREENRWIILPRLQRRPGDETMDKTASTDEQIKQRAFELWQQHGSQDGYQTEFWAQAERELKGERNTIGTTSNAASAKSGSGSDGPG